MENTNINGGTTSSYSYWPMTTTKTKIVDIYKITKKGKEKLVGRKRTTVTVSKHQNVGSVVVTSTPYVYNPGPTAEPYTVSVGPASNVTVTSGYSTVESEK